MNTNNKIIDYIDNLCLNSNNENLKYILLLILQKMNETNIDNIIIKKELLKTQSIINYNSDFSYEQPVNIKYLENYYINDNSIKMAIIKLNHKIKKLKNKKKK